MHEFDVHPSDLGLPTANIESLLGGTPEHNAEALRRTLAGEQGAVRDIVLFNAAAGIVAYRLFQDPAQAQRNLIQRRGEAVDEAAAAIDDGRATAQAQRRLIQRVGGAWDEARAATCDGRATAKLEQWVTATRRFDTE